MPTLDRWNISPHSSPDAPRLAGRVKGHPKHHDNTWILTSTIVRAEGRTAFTTGGTRYELGEPEPAWVEYLKEEGRPLDAENPLAGFVRER